MRFCKQPKKKKGPTFEMDGFANGVLGTTVYYCLKPSDMNLHNNSVFYICLFNKFRLKIVCFIKAYTHK